MRALIGLINVGRASIAERSRVRLRDVVWNNRLAGEEQKLYGGLPNVIVGIIVVALATAVFIKLSPMLDGNSKILCCSARL